MAENKKIKVKDENDKTLFEVKLDNSKPKKSHPIIKILILLLIIPCCFVVGYFFFK